MIESKDTPGGLQKVVGAVCALNLSYFFVEFFIGLKIGSVALFADSLDFFEDAAVNFLILVGLSWSAKNRAKLGMVLSGVLLLPAVAMIWSIFRKFQAPIPPEPFLLTVTGAGALLINFSCALMLARFRHHSGSLTKAAFLSARNDVFANIGIIVAGFITSLFPTIWPDLIVGLGIAFMNIDAAKEVWQAAREEHSATP